MAVSIREQEIQRLIRFYRSSVQGLAQEFVEGVDFLKPTFAGRMQSALNLLDELDEKTERWAQRNIANLYKSASTEAEAWAKKNGIAIKDLARAKAFTAINHQAVQALLNDPAIGFLTGTKQAIRQIKDRMKLIRNQAKLLVAKQKLFDETIARVGFLEGSNLNTVRDRLVNEMVSLKNNSEMVWTTKAAQLPTTEIVHNVANLPFVKIPDARAKLGYRRLRVDKYAEILARTKTGQAANLARRNRAMQHEQYLVQISPNRPLQDDACYLYIGKVFALTEAAKQEFGVPMVNELPNGGAPFHPNCTHQERIFVPRFKRPAAAKTAMVPPPDWALNRPWPEVQREYEKRGGSRNVKQWNKAPTRTTGGRERWRKEAGLPPEAARARLPGAPPEVRPAKPLEISVPQIEAEALPQAVDTVVERYTENVVAAAPNFLTGPLLHSMIVKRIRRELDSILSKIEGLAPRIQAGLLEKLTKQGTDEALNQLKFVNAAQRAEDLVDQTVDLVVTPALKYGTIEANLQKQVAVEVRGVVKNRLHALHPAGLTSEQIKAKAADLAGDAIEAANLRVTKVAGEYKDSLAYFHEVADSQIASIATEMARDGALIGMGEGQAALAVLKAVRVRLKDIPLFKTYVNQFPIQLREDFAEGLVTRAIGMVRAKQVVKESLDELDKWLAVQAKEINVEKAIENAISANELSITNVIAKAGVDPADLATPETAAATKYREAINGNLFASIEEWVSKQPGYKVSPKIKDELRKRLFAARGGDINDAAYAAAKKSVESIQSGIELIYDDTVGAAKTAVAIRSEKIREGFLKQYKAGELKYDLPKLDVNLNELAALRTSMRKSLEEIWDQNIKPLKDAGLADVAIGADRHAFVDMALKANFNILIKEAKKLPPEVIQKATEAAAAKAAKEAGAMAAVGVDPFHGVPIKMIKGKPTQKAVVEATSREVEDELYKFWAEQQASGEGASLGQLYKKAREVRNTYMTKHFDQYRHANLPGGFTNQQWYKMGLKVTENTVYKVYGTTISAFNEAGGAGQSALKYYQAIKAKDIFGTQRSQASLAKMAKLPPPPKPKPVKIGGVDIKFTKGKPTQKSVVEGFFYDTTVEDALLIDAGKTMSSYRYFYYGDFKRKLEKSLKEQIDGLLDAYFQAGTIDSALRKKILAKAMKKLQPKIGIIVDESYHAFSAVGPGKPWASYHKYLADKKMFERLAPLPKAKSTLDVLTSKVEAKVTGSPIKPKPELVVNKTDFPKDLTELKDIKNLGGSTGARLVEDAKGRRFVKKTGASKAHLREEFRAEQLYRKLGVNVPESVVYDTPQGPVKISKWIDGVELGKLKGKAFDDAAAQIRGDLATDALMANWDVVGMGADNILVDAAGRVWRIDVGGSLRYRAMGKLKNGDWGRYPVELWTLADGSKNPAAARVFAGITHTERLKQMRRVLARRKEILATIDNEDVQKMVAARLDEFEDIVSTAKIFEQDSFGVDTYINEMNRHGLGLKASGVMDRIPKQLKARGNSLVDEHGKAFGSFRGSDSVVHQLKQYVEANGGKWSSIEAWAGDQAGDSWNTAPRAFKYLMAKERGEYQRYYWHPDPRFSGLSGVEASEKAFDKVIAAVMRDNNVGREEAIQVMRQTWTSLHAFTYHMLRTMKIPNVDLKRGLIKLKRTERLSNLRHYNIQPNVPNQTMLRGYCESCSLLKKTTVQGSELTIQEVPLHRVVATYFLERRPGSHASFFFGDGESEFLTILEGIRFIWKKTF